MFFFYFIINAMNNQDEKKTILNIVNQESKKILFCFGFVVKLIIIIIIITTTTFLYLLDHFGSVLFVCVCVYVIFIGFFLSFSCCNVQWIQIVDKDSVFILVFDNIPDSVHHLYCRMQYR